MAQLYNTINTLDKPNIEKLLINISNRMVRFADLYEQQLLCDINLIVDRFLFPAHRLVLCASSSVFMNMLTNPEWIESKENNITLKEDSCCLEVFSTVLNYLYTGKIYVSLQTVIPIVILADKYDIKDLVKICLEYINTHVVLPKLYTKYVTLVNQASTTCPCIMNEFQLFCETDFHLMVTSNAYLNLNATCLIGILKQQELGVKDEIANKWLVPKIADILSSQLPEEHIQSVVRQLIESVVVHIRFGIMTKDNLATIMFEPIVKHHMSYFVERVSIGLFSHFSGKTEMDKVRTEFNGGALQFTWRKFMKHPY